MSEEVQKKRIYKKAGPNDKRRETSRANIAKAREKKLEILRAGKEKLRDPEPDNDRWKIESESEDSSDSSDSDEDVIVIQPKKKRQVKQKKEEIKEVNKDTQQRSIQDELNDVKQLIQGLTKKKRYGGSGKKRQVTNIVIPPANPPPAQVVTKDPDFDMFKKLLLTQIK